MGCRLGQTVKELMKLLDGMTSKMKQWQEVEKKEEGEEEEPRTPMKRKRQKEEGLSPVLLSQMSGEETEKKKKKDEKKEVIELKDDEEKATRKKEKVEVEQQGQQKEKKKPLAFVEKVLKKDERAKLKGSDCPQCRKWFDTMGGCPDSNHGEFGCLSVGVCEGERPILLLLW